MSLSHEYRECSISAFLFACLSQEDIVGVLDPQYFKALDSRKCCMHSFSFLAYRKIIMLRSSCLSPDFHVMEKIVDTRLGHHHALPASLGLVPSEMIQWKHKLGLICILFQIYLFNLIKLVPNKEAKYLLLIFFPSIVYLRRQLKYLALSMSGCYQVCDLCLIRSTQTSYTNTRQWQKFQEPKY